MSTPAADPAPAEPAPRAPSALERWSPGVVDLLVVALVLPFAWRPVTFTHDTWWHLRLGRRVLDEPVFPRHETFSWTAPGAALHHSSWLSDALFAGLERAGGPGAAGLGLVEVLGLVLIAFVLRLAWSLGRALGAAPTACALGLLGLALGSFPHLILRPHLFTLAGFTWLFLEYVRLRQDPTRLRRLALLAPPLLLVWANLHGGFLLGIAFLAGVGGLEALEARWGPEPGRLDARRRAALLLVLVPVGLFVSCLHPQGPSQLGWSLAAVGDPTVRNIDEWLPTPLRETRSFELALLLAPLVALAQPRWPGPFELGALLGSAHLALTTWRHLPLFGIAGHAVLAAWTTRALAARRAPLEAHAPLAGRVARRLNALLARGERGPGGWVALLGLGLALGLSRLAAPRDPFQDEGLRRRYPVAAVEWVRAHAPPGPMWNPYPWGGYLGWALGEAHPVSIDSRLSPFGAEHLTEYFRVYELKDGWEEPLLRRGVGWVIVPRDARLARGLEQSPRWERAYRDEVAEVFVRRAP